MKFNRNINSEILHLAIPAIATNITVPLLGFSDTVIAGHLGGSDPLGAIAVGSMMMNVVFWLFGFLRMGTTGLTAQSFGRGHSKGCQIVFSRAFLLASLIGLFIILLSSPVSELLLRFIHPDIAVRKLAENYFKICILGTPAILATMTVQGWFLGMQTSVYPMVISISVNILNILLSVIFVFPCKFGFTGLAYGTTSANWFGLLLALVLAKHFQKDKKLWCRKKDLLKKKALSKFFHVNTDIFLRSACIMAVSLSVTAFGAHQGSIILGANAVMMQFFHFFSYFMDGFAFAAEAETGKFAGALNFPGLRNSIMILLFWSGGIAVIFFIIYLLWWNPIISLMTDSIEIRECIYHYRTWLWLIPPLTVAAFIFDGMYIGITATRRMLVTTLTASVTFFAISLLCIGRRGIELNYPDNDNLWGAFIAYLIVRGAMLAIQSKYVFSKNYIIRNIC